MFHLKQVCSNYSMKIAELKIKTMASVDKYLLRTKIVVDNKSTEEMSHFRCKITYDVDHYVLEPNPQHSITKKHVPTTEVP